MTRNVMLTVTALAATAFLVPTVAFAQSDRSGGRSEDAINQAKQAASEKALSASDRAVAIKNKADSTSLKVRQEVCEQKRTRLQTSTKTMYQGAISVKSSLDTVYDRVVGFYDQGKLTVDNYQQHIDAIELAKQEAAASMQALELRENADIDCTDAKTAARLEGDRLAGKETKAQLKDYRTKLVDLISALKSAAATEEVNDEAQ